MSDLDLHVARPIRLPPPRTLKDEIDRWSLADEWRQDIALNGSLADRIKREREVT